MLCTINEIFHLENFKNVPAALREKRAAAMEQTWEQQFGVRIDGYQPGVMRVDISKSHRDLVMQWLAEAGIALVTLEPRDVETIWSKRDPISLGIVHMLQVGDPTVQRELSNLEPEEIFPTLEKLAWSALRTVEVNPLDEHVVAERLKAIGVDVPGDNTDFYEPPAPYEPTHDNDLDFGLLPAAPDANLFETAKNDLPGTGDF